MKVSTKEFSNCLQFAKKTAFKKFPGELTKIKLIGSNAGLTIQATDLALSYSATIPGSFDSFACLVSADIADYIKAIKAETIEISIVDDVLIVNSGSSSRNFTLGNVDKFPEIFPITESLSISADYADMKSIFQKLEWSTSEDPTRFFMNGIFFKIEENSIILCTTDGRVLSEVKPNFLVAGNLADNSAIVPPVIFKTMLSQKTKEFFNFGISEDSKEFFVKVGIHEFRQTVIDGCFPNYKRVIPESNKFSIDLNVAEIRESLKSLKSDKFITLTFSADTLEIRGGIDYIKISQKNKNPDFIVKVNRKYFLDVLALADKVTLKYTEDSKALVMDIKDSNIYLIMPCERD